MATAVIGDIHGNLRALDDLLAQLHPLLAAKDTAVFLGDYIDRGPDTRGCIDRILRWQDESPATVITLLGNHEDWLLRSITDPARHSWLLGWRRMRRSRATPFAWRMSSGSLWRTPDLASLPNGFVLPYRLLVEAMPSSHLDFLKPSSFTTGPTMPFASTGD